MTSRQVGAEPFDPAQRDLRINRAAARFTSSAPTESDQKRNFGIRGNGRSDRRDAESAEKSQIKNARPKGKSRRPLQIQ